MNTSEKRMVDELIKATLHTATLATQLLDYLQGTELGVGYIATASPPPFLDIEKMVAALKGTPEWIERTSKKRSKATEEVDMLINIPGVSIDSKPRKDGRWQGRITKNGKTQSVYGKDRKDVEAKIRDILAGKKSKRKKTIHKKRPPTVNYTVALWLDEWFTLYKKPNLKPLTALRVESSLNQIKKRFGNTILRQLNTHELQEYFSAYDGSRSRDIQLQYLRLAISKAVRLQLLKSNPCDEVEIRKHKYGKRNALTLTEQRIFQKAIETHQLQPLLTLLLTTGLRIGEALALTGVDIDRERMEVNVNKSVAWIRGKKVLQAPKSQAGFRRIPLPKSTLILLPSVENNQELFPITYNSVKLYVKRLKDKLQKELPELFAQLSVHTLRHTYATRLDEAGVAPKVKMYWLGHSSLDMTQNVYTDLQQEHIERQKKDFLDAIDTDFDTEK